MVVPKGQIRLPVQANTDVVEVDFIVVDVLSIHGYYGPTLAPYPRSGLFYPSLEGKVPIRRPSLGDSGKSGRSSTIPSGSYPTPAESGDLDNR